MKRKVIVLGASGLIGHQVSNHLRSFDEYDVHNFSFRNKVIDDTTILDARDEELFLGHIHDLKPDFIINCLGILINDANKNPENAIFLNAYLPHRVARLSDNINAKLIHISTDCVFSGDKGASYIESDFKDGKVVYAKTKGLGEIISNTHLTLRTSVVGPELKKDGEELFHWFMEQNGSISGFSKSIWSGVTTIELAKAVEWAIRKNITGLYNLTNNSTISKYELLKLFQKHTGKNIHITCINGKKTNKSFLDTRKLLDYSIPSYDIMIFEMVGLIKAKHLIYSHYDIK